MNRMSNPNFMGKPRTTDLEVKLEDLLDKYEDQSIKIHMLGSSDHLHVPGWHELDEFTRCDHPDCIGARRVIETYREVL